MQSQNLNADIEAYKKEVGMMNLEKLIAAREVIDTRELAIPVKELLTRYEALYTGAISDVLREHALLDQALPGHLIPLRPERTVAGIAFTVKSAPNVKITGEMTFRTQMISELPADSMVVWDTSHDERATLWSRHRRDGGDFFAKPQGRPWEYGRQIVGAVSAKSQANSQ